MSLNLLLPLEGFYGLRSHACALMLEAVRGLAVLNNALDSSYSCQVLLKMDGISISPVIYSTLVLGLADLRGFCQRNTSACPPATGLTFGCVVLFDWFV